MSKLANYICPYIPNHKKLSRFMAGAKIDNDIFFVT